MLWHVAAAWLTKHRWCQLSSSAGVLMQEEAPAGDDDAKGIEMEGDFEGSLHDIPANPEVDSSLSLIRCEAHAPNCLPLRFGET